jgi:NAD(P)-dependent dehydrogenase (short-subunit alcohol dehydrogenase family)
VAAVPSPSTPSAAPSSELASLKRGDRLAGKVALVTGGASGIGQATCVLFAAQGASVVVADLPGVSARRTTDLIAAYDGTVVHAEGDVRSTDDARRLVQTAVERFGRLDVLFNNAGIEYTASLEDTPEDAWDRVLDTNLKGVYQLSRAAIPVMRSQGSGSIVNTASQLGWVGVPLLAAYCASKGGVVNLTRSMALELAPLIRVNALCPGAVDTPMVQREFASGSGPQGSMDDLVNMHALKRLGRPIELAYGALFLASDESSFMTGASLVVDGGYIAL